MAVCKPDFHSSDFHSSDFSTTINETVFNWFITDKLPEYFRRNDTYKDKNNEGLLIRFLSILRLLKLSLIFEYLKLMNKHAV